MSEFPSADVDISDVTLKQDISILIGFGNHFTMSEFPPPDVGTSDVTLV